MNQWNVFFINKSGIIHFIFSDHFPFLIVLNKRKNKSMGNCISKISKDRFFDFEEDMKNVILFLKGKIRISPEWGGIRGITYTRAHSIKKLSEKMTLAPLETGMWWRDL